MRPKKVVGHPGVGRPPRRVFYEADKQLEGMTLWAGGPGLRRHQMY